MSEPLKFHPLADIFPLMRGPEFDDLVADIRTHGLIESIVIYEGKVLDGRNRYRACEEAGVWPKFEDYTGNTPAAYVISANIRRRHLTAEQRHDLIAKLVKAQPEKSDRQIAEMTKSSPTTVGAVRRETETESTVQSGQLPPKRIGKDGKARKPPRPRSNQAWIRIGTSSTTPSIWWHGWTKASGPSSSISWSRNTGGRWSRG
jgi:hypothetical protein